MLGFEGCLLVEQQDHKIRILVTVASASPENQDHKIQIFVSVASTPTFVPSRPVPKCTPVTMLCRLRNPILDLTHQKFIRVQLVPIRGNSEDCFFRQSGPPSAVTRNRCASNPAIASHNKDPQHLGLGSLLKRQGQEDNGS